MHNTLEIFDKNIPSVIMRFGSIYNKPILYRLEINKNQYYESIPFFPL